eukprot:6018885-Prymnesium_polylepis.1
MQMQMCMYAEGGHMPRAVTLVSCMLEGHAERRLARRMSVRQRLSVFECSNAGAAAAHRGGRGREAVGVAAPLLGRARQERIRIEARGAATHIWGG